MNIPNRQVLSRSLYKKEKNSHFVRAGHTTILYSEMKKCQNMTNTIHSGDSNIVRRQLPVCLHSIYVFSYFLWPRIILNSLNFNNFRATFIRSCFIRVSLTLNFFCSPLQDVQKSVHLWCYLLNKEIWPCFYSLLISVAYKKPNTYNAFDITTWRQSFNPSFRCFLAIWIWYIYLSLDL